MCGIAGLFRTQGVVAPPEIQGVERMLDAQLHRGPDDQGLFRHPQALLGHRRLSILDTSSAGRQPMANEDQTVQVVFNGEIYNFQDLRRELETAGHRFVSRTDTEVLVHGYEAWGMEGLLEHLRGMFAFALLDLSARSGPRLFLARDRFGIKPLYYYQDHEKILFASEVRAMQASGLIPDRLNAESLLRFLELGSVPAPLTTVQKVWSLPAGHYLSLGRGPVEPTNYWDLARVLDQPVRPVTRLEAVEETRRQLLDAVQGHLISDVPLGIFLSGGIDSSSLTALASRLQPGHVTTLSVLFDEPAYDEGRYARLVARQYGTDHREIRVRRQAFEDELPRMLAAMDQPTLDGINTYVVSKAAHEAGLKVVLSGLGGDELFSGYRHLHHARWIGAAVRGISCVPPGVRGPLLSLVESLSRPSHPGVADKLWCLRDMDPASPYRLFRALFPPERIAGLLGVSVRDTERARWVPEGVDVLKRFPEEERLRLLEFDHYLQNQLLKDSDVMSMAHSLELRVPFLDHRLVEEILRLPPDVRRSSQSKGLLVEAMGPEFPREVWDRPKQGFTFPFGEWFRQKADDFEAMALEHTPLERKAVQAIWAGVRAGRLHWSRAWATVIVARFYGGSNDVIPGGNWPGIQQCRTTILDSPPVAAGNDDFRTFRFVPKPQWVVLLTDLFGALGGITTFNRALVAALRAIAKERGWALQFLVLHDAPTARRLAGADVRSFGGSRLRFFKQAVCSLRKADGAFFGHAHFSPLVWMQKKNSQSYAIAHGIDVWQKLPLLRRLGLRKMSRILAVSRYTLDQMLSRNGLSPEQGDVFPDTIDPAFNNRVVMKTRRELSLPEGPMILTVSRLSDAEHYKNIDWMIERLSDVRRDVPAAFLVVVGDGPDRSRLEALARRCGVNQQVIFAGRVSGADLPSYYEACDVFALPSEGEGFGIVFLEAMSHGKPCVGARAGGVPEVVVHDVTGLLVEPRQGSSLVAALVLLLKDAALASRFGEAGREHLEQTFSVERFRQRLETILDGRKEVL
ncbi:MAG: asparagine synthase (glutamine-hydrolyzing) [Elusimicrobiota bacterium]|jgi:asparagine synthase (glutamine-hydrolysing)